jgi:hypothetical protein
MITVRIILAVLAIVLCCIAAIAQFAMENFGYGLALLVLGILNLYLLKDAIDDSHAKEKNEPVSTVVSDVVEYKIDSTITINNADTTKAYTITYWKYE